MSKPSAQGDRSVLVVDDDAVCRYFCEQVLSGISSGDLSGRQHQILLAATAEAAIELARRRQPAVIVLDLHLRDRSGQAVRSIVLQQWPPTVPPPVFIAMSGDGQQFGDFGLLDGFSAALSKPFSAGKLQTMVEQALGTQRAVVCGNAATPISAAEKLERALRAEWNAGLVELDRHIFLLDWSAATCVLHRLCGAAAVAGHPELARGARRLMNEITREAGSAGMTRAYVDFLWQGAEFTWEPMQKPAAFRRCESIGPFP